MSPKNSALNFLIIEDNEGDYVLISDLIEENFPTAKIEWAKTYEAAVKTIPNGFDIILLDLSLGEMSGEILIKDIQKEAPKIPIVVLTGYTNKDFAVKTIGLGISDYLIKDELHPEILLRSITYSIERKRVFNKLEESELRYKELFQFNPMPMWVMNFDTKKFLNVNDAAVKSYGFSVNEFLEMTIADIEVKDSCSSVPGRDKDDGLISGKSKDRSLHKKKNGEIINVETNLNTVRINGVKVKLMLSIDVTFKLAHLRTIEKQNDRLKEISWLQSHVVRAPLARLMGLVHLLELMIGDLPDDQSEILAYINKSALELDNVIRNINNKTRDIDN